MSTPSSMRRVTSSGVNRSRRCRNTRPSVPTVTRSQAVMPSLLDGRSASNVASLGRIAVLPPVGEAARNPSEAVLSRHSKRRGGEFVCSASLREAPAHNRRRA